MITKLPILSLLLCIVAGCGQSEQNSNIPNQTPLTNSSTTNSSINHMKVQTYQGWLKGSNSTLKPNISVFKGIPYAAPPTGDARWLPPRSAQPWQGERDATKFGAACPQPTNFDQFVWSRDDFTINEDCLYLNVWSDLEVENKPVMVWFHGGAHTAGKGHDAIFDGSALADKGVVLVTVNYRLGVLGFLAHPWLTEESDQNASGNYGLLDKIVALNWVRDNIAQFGGNPDNVTIFGQSAGSQSVCSLMVSPLAQGLFHKVIGQSASCLNPQPQKDQNGIERGQQLAQSLDAKNLQDLRRASPAALMQAAETSGWANRSRITVDGWVVPESPDLLFAQQKQSKVPVLIGSLANEGNQLFPLNANLSRDELNTAVLRLIGETHLDEALKLYKQDLSQSPGLALREISTDLFMAYGMRRWAQHQSAIGQPAYLYFMDHNPPAFRLYNPGKPDLSLTGGPRSAGAYHSGDLAYVFGTTHHVGHDWQEDDHELSDNIMSYWTNFAKQSDPNGSELPRWDKYSAENNETLLIQTVKQGTAQTVNGVRSAKLNLFEKALN